MKGTLGQINEGFDRMSLGAFVCFCAAFSGLMFIAGVTISVVAPTLPFPGTR
jgi:hypothetical protein